MAEGGCAVGNLIDISNNSESFHINDCQYRKSYRHNVPTGILVDLSNSSFLNYSEVKFDHLDAETNQIISNNVEIKNNHNSLEISNNSIISDSMLWDPKLRLDYWQQDNLATNFWDENQTESNVQSSKVVEGKEKVDQKSKDCNPQLQSSLAITSTPTDKAPNVDENFKIFKRELSFGSSPSEQRRRSVISSSAGSMLAINLNLKPHNLQPLTLFNEQKGIGFKPCVPSRRTSCKNQELINNEQKNKINLKTRVSLAPQPKQLINAPEPIAGVKLPPIGLKPFNKANEHLKVAKLSTLRASVPEQSQNNYIDVNLQQLTKNKIEIIERRLKVNSPHTSSSNTQQRNSNLNVQKKPSHQKLSLPHDIKQTKASQIRISNSRSSTPTTNKNISNQQKSNLFNNQKSSSAQKFKENESNKIKHEPVNCQSGKGASRLPSLDRKNQSTKSLTNSNTKLKVRQHSSRDVKIKPTKNVASEQIKKIIDKPPINHSRPPSKNLKK